MKSDEKWYEMNRNVVKSDESWGKLKTLKIVRMNRGNGNVQYSSVYKGSLVHQLRESIQSQCCVTTTKWRGIVRMNRGGVWWMVATQCYNNNEETSDRLQYKTTKIHKNESSNAIRETCKVTHKYEQQFNKINENRNIPYYDVKIKTMNSSCGRRFGPVKTG